MKKAVIFDLDGCLVESEVLSLRALAREIHRLGATDVDEVELGRELLGFNMASISDWIARRTGRPTPAQFPARFEEGLMELYREELRAVDGAQALLGRLRDGGFDIALATGSSIKRMRLALKLAKLEVYFDGAVCSADEVARGKPAPDLFLHAASVLGRAPGDCVVVEDSPHGVKGALEAGMHAVGFIGGGHLAGCRDEHADRLVRAGCSTVIGELSEFDALVLADTPLS